MKPFQKKFITVDEYLALLPSHVRNIIEELRVIIKQTAPQAEEVISYNMPAFKLNGILVYYAVHQKHIGFYPTPSAIESFKDELKEYKTSKGAIQFPLERPIPKILVKNIIEFRVYENLEKAADKKKIKKGSY